MKLIKCNSDEQYIGNDFYLHRLIYEDKGVHEGWILNQSNPFWKLPFDDKKNLIQPWLDEFASYNMVWVEEFEAHYLEEQDIQGQQPSIQFFKDLGVDVLYKTNAMGGLGYKELRHEPIGYWIGKNASKNFEIPQHRTFEKRFLYLNRVDKSWRFKFFSGMYRQRYLQDCIWSWAADNEYDPLHKSIEGFPIVGETSHLEMELIPEYNKTFCSIVPETFFSTDGVCNEATFITEKTEKCFAVGHPFIIVSTPYFLENLKRLGFRTFDKWWDEGYDEELDPNQRMHSVYEAIHYVQSWSEEKCQQVYKEMIPTLLHNQKRNKELIQKYNTDNRNWCEFNGDFIFKTFSSDKNLI